MNNPLLKTASLAIILTGALACTARAEQLFDWTTATEGTDIFAAGGSGTGAGGTGSGKFFYGGSNPIPVPHTKLQFQNGVTTANTLDYFVGKFNSRSLTTVGDTLSLSFTATITNLRTDIGQTLRFGLFNTTGTTNGFGNATGYRADYGASNSGNGIRERTGTNDVLWSTGTVSPLVGDQDSSNFTFTPANGVAYTGSFTIELLSGNRVAVTSQIGSVTATSIIDDATPFTTFNAFSFLIINGTERSDINFSNLSVDFTAGSTIPEPSTWTLLAGASVVVLAAMLRKFRKHP
ncbi:anchor protein [Opitutaceae bacterium TAV5]|nr:anchor protein [Opitutaceae bacterium TAV5]